MNAEPEKIIARLRLVPLPQEGGFYRQTWTSQAQLANGRAAASAIWFLLTREDFSALHRLKAEELWHFHAGDPVEHVQLDPVSATVQVTLLGADVLAGQVPQLVVSGGVWQGARPNAGTAGNGWTLLGCTVTPAWDDRDFELGARVPLMRDFPQAEELIVGLTR
ncbi:MAG: cupin domain-containing protein [Opitutaceae bacterium]